VWFLLKGATAHFILAVPEWFGRHYTRYWIGGPKVPMQWPSQLPDLNHICFYLCSSMKNADFANIIDATKQHWQHIQEETNEIHTAAGVF
jgi:hypothetical protein